MTKERFENTLGLAIGLLPLAVCIGCVLILIFR